MKASNFSDAQRAFVVKPGEEGTPVTEIYRKARDQPGGVLQLEEEIRRAFAIEDAVTARAGG